MNYALVFRINSTSITISKTTRSIDKKGINNTNIINTKELKFDPEYIVENIELVATFLNVIIIKNNINTCIINTNEYIPTLVELTNNWEKINNLIIKEDVQITYDIFMKLLDNNYLTNLECYSIPCYLMEMLDKNKNIKIHTREKKQYTTRFMQDNFLNSYSEMFYKKTIIITSAFDELALYDFKNFIAINKGLKTIRIVNFSSEALTSVMDVLKEYKKKKIEIIIDEKNNDLDFIYKSIPFVKKTYKNYINECGIKFKIKYSLEYKKNNFIKEINVKTLSAIILIIILLVLGCMGLNAYKEARDQNKVEEQMDEIQQILDNYTITDNNKDNPDTPIDGNEGEEQQQAAPRRTGGSPGTYYTNYSRVVTDLLTINPDTVGWIKVNNTRMDYPVVQGTNNDYYLNRDFKKKKNSMGWIFMDYRNNKDNLDKNTIIYGHNIKGGIMFGGITNMFSNYYLSKEENNYITFNTKDKNMRWRIFSMYKINETSDYTQTEFESDEEYQNFINMIQSRSQYRFDVSVTPNDKIITLSTCFSSKTRSVVHAVLVNE
ncbi:MAG: class B sortase [Bacilli bacterium]|nr:class B sortase [Bacilli bacterium]